MKRTTRIGAIVAVAILLVYVSSYLLFRPLAAPGVHVIRILGTTTRVETSPSSELPGLSKRLADHVYALPLAIDRWTTKSEVSFGDHTVTITTGVGIKIKAGSKP